MLRHSGVWPALKLLQAPVQQVLPLHHACEVCTMHACFKEDVRYSH